MSFADSYLGQLRQALGSRPLIAVGIRLLVEDHQGRFLNIRRADSLEWGLPGGAMELGESLMEAAHREAMEEANLTLVAPQAFGLSSDPTIEHHTYPNGDVLQNVSLLIHARPGPDAPAANDGEALGFRYIAPAQIDPESFVTTEYPTFAHYARFRQSGQFQIV